MSEDVLSPDDARAAREAAARLDVGRPLPPVSDTEVATLWRQTKALADSGLFAGSRQGTSITAGQAFAKALAGRELGLGPFESMQQLHVLPDGKLEASSDLHATKVREREGYDFDVWWIKSKTGAHYYDAQSGAVGAAPEGEREAVRAADDDPADLRPVVGCALVFTVDGERRGVSTFTIEDSLRANLTRNRGNAKSLHVTYPRNMYYARAMTNGITFYVPEVMGGLRVYGLGELPRDDGPSLTGGGGEPAQMDDLPTEVEAIIARARGLGHVGLQDRGTARMAVQGGADVLARWIKAATQTLNRLDRARQEETQESAVSEQTPETPGHTPEGAGAPQAPQEGHEAGDPQDGPGEATRTDEDDRAEALEHEQPAEVVDGEAVVDPEAEAAAAVASERERLERAVAEAETAAEDANAAGDEASAQFYAAEAVAAREQLAGLNPDQSALDVGA